MATRITESEMLDELKAASKSKAEQRAVQRKKEERELERSRRAHATRDARKILRHIEGEGKDWMSSEAIVRAFPTLKVSGGVDWLRRILSMAAVLPESRWRWAHEQDPEHPEWGSRRVHSCFDRAAIRCDGYSVRAIKEALGLRRFRSEVGA